MSKFPCRISAVDHLDNKSKACLEAMKRCCTPLPAQEAAILDADDVVLRMQLKACGKNTIPLRLPVRTLYGPKLGFSDEASLIEQISIEGPSM